MNTITTTDGKYIGLYLHIKDNDFSVKMFTKFYNLATQNNAYSINSDTVRDLIHTRRYGIRETINQIYVNDPITNTNILKSINVGDYMIFIHDTKKLYILDEDEFNKFINKNDYSKNIATTYIFGINDGVKFKNMHMITSNSFENAKNIYMDRYNCEEPVCIGIVENNQLTILGDKHNFTVPLVI